MLYTVPQFIEKEPKIAGPFTFKQLVFLLAAAGLAVFFYFVLPRFLFILAAIILGAGALALAFFRVGGIALPVVIKNFFVFLTRPRVYLWKKKQIPPKIIKEPQARQERSSLITSLRSILETKSK